MVLSEQDNALYDVKLNIQTLYGVLVQHELQHQARNIVGNGGQSHVKVVVAVMGDENTNYGVSSASQSLVSCTSGNHESYVATWIGTNATSNKSIELEATLHRRLELIVGLQTTTITNDTTKTTTTPIGACNLPLFEALRLATGNENNGSVILDLPVYNIKALSMSQDPFATLNYSTKTAIPLLRKLSFRKHPPQQQPPVYTFSMDTEANTSLLRVALQMLPAAVSSPSSEAVPKPRAVLLHAQAEAIETSHTIFRSMSNDLPLLQDILAMEPSIERVLSSEDGPLPPPRPPSPPPYRIKIIGEETPTKNDQKLFIEEGAVERVRSLSTANETDSDAVTLKASPRNRQSPSSSSLNTPPPLRIYSPVSVKAAFSEPVGVGHKFLHVSHTAIECEFPHGGGELGSSSKRRYSNSNSSGSNTSRSSGKSQHRRNHSTPTSPVGVGQKLLHVSHTAIECEFPHSRGELGSSSKRRYSNGSGSNTSRSSDISQHRRNHSTPSSPVPRALVTPSTAGSSSEKRDKLRILDSSVESVLTSGSVQSEVCSDNNKFRKSKNSSKPPMHPKAMRSADERTSQSRFEGERNKLCISDTAIERVLSTRGNSDSPRIIKDKNVVSRRSGKPVQNQTSMPADALHESKLRISNGAIERVLSNNFDSTMRHSKKISRSDKAVENSVAVRHQDDLLVDSLRPIVDSQQSHSSSTRMLPPPPPLRRVCSSPDIGIVFDKSEPLIADTAIERVLSPTPISQRPGMAIRADLARDINGGRGPQVSRRGSKQSPSPSNKEKKRNSGQNETEHLTFMKLSPVPPKAPSRIFKKLLPPEVEKPRKSWFGMVPQEKKSEKKIHSELTIATSSQSTDKSLSSEIQIFNKGGSVRSAMTSASQWKTRISVGSNTKTPPSTPSLSSRTSAASPTKSSTPQTPSSTPSMSSRSSAMSSKKLTSSTTAFAKSSISKLTTTEPDEAIHIKSKSFLPSPNIVGHTTMTSNPEIQMTPLRPPKPILRNKVVPPVLPQVTTTSPTIPLSIVAVVPFAPPENLLTDTPAAELGSSVDQFTTPVRQKNVKDDTFGGSWKLEAVVDYIPHQQGSPNVSDTPLKTSNLSAAEQEAVSPARSTMSTYSDPIPVFEEHGDMIFGKKNNVSECDSIASSEHEMILPPKKRSMFGLIPSCGNFAGVSSSAAEEDTIGDTYTLDSGTYARPATIKEEIRDLLLNGGLCRLGGREGDEYYLDDDDTMSYRRQKKRWPVPEGSTNKGITENDWVHHLGSVIMKQFGDKFTDADSVAHETNTSRSVTIEDDGSSYYTGRETVESQADLNTREESIETDIYSSLKLEKGTKVGVEKTQQSLALVGVATSEQRGQPSSKKALRYPEMDKTIGLERASSSNSKLKRFDTLSEDSKQKSIAESKRCISPVDSIQFLAKSETALLKEVDTSASLDVVKDTADRYDNAYSRFLPTTDRIQDLSTAKDDGSPKNVMNPPIVRLMSKKSWVEILAEVILPGPEDGCSDSLALNHIPSTLDVDETGSVGELTATTYEKEVNFEEYRRQVNRLEQQAHCLDQGPDDYFADYKKQSDRPLLSSQISSTTTESRRHEQQQNQ